MTSFDTFSSKRFALSTLANTLILTLLYFFWFVQFVGLRSEHTILYGIIILLFFATQQTRDFVKGYGIFVVYWIVYDSLRVLPNYEVNPIHIQEPYQIEKALFGIIEKGKLLTLNEYFTIYHTTFLDLLTGFFYLNWVPVPLGLALYLYFTDKPMFFRFSYCFVFINFLGFLVYYAYPAAPPWYVATYGFEPHLNIHTSIAGLSHFDEIVGKPIFADLYKKNSNVFAAIPSLHSTYPLIVLYYGIKKRFGWLNLIFGMLCFGIWFTAVYSGHHYVIDVLAGICMAILGIIIFERYLAKIVLRYML